MKKPIEPKKPEWNSMSYGWSARKPDMPLKQVSHKTQLASIEPDTWRCMTWNEWKTYLERETKQSFDDPNIVLEFTDGGDKGPLQVTIYQTHFLDNTYFDDGMIAYQRQLKIYEEMEAKFILDTQTYEKDLANYLIEYDKWLLETSRETVKRLEQKFKEQGDTQ